MKKLFLRLDLSLYTAKQIQQIRNFFNTYFLETLFLDISQQRIQLQKLIQDNPESVVVSMDKFLPTEHNLDASRVYDSETSKYLFHNIKFNGKLVRNQNVILYDHDKVGGLGIKLVTSLLETMGNTVTEHVFISLTKEESKESEILDFADFINTGLVCQMPDGSLKRILYNSSPEILESRASIPAESFESFNSDLSILLASIATKE